MPPEAQDAHWIRLALEQAGRAGRAGEVPVGAVLVQNGQCVAQGRNACIAHHDPTAHAEIQVLRAGAKKLGNYRLQDCTLYVSLEPCAMCAGAILHARLQRVVFAAFDPKTGAAGSVLNLFRHPQLNHQTQVQGGVLALASQTLLQGFFKSRRKNTQALREDALRTPAAAFENLPGWPAHAHSRHLSDLPALEGLRLHYLDAGKPKADHTWFCLHDHFSWAYLYRHLINALAEAKQRIIAPDLIGFGQSDKPKKKSVCSMHQQQQILLELMARLQLQNTILLVQGSAAMLGIMLLYAAPELFQGMVLMNPLPDGRLPGISEAAGQRKQEQWLMTQHPGLAANERAAYAAPFPDVGHSASVQAWPALLDAAGRASTHAWPLSWPGRVLWIQSRNADMPAAAELAAWLRAQTPFETLKVAHNGWFLPEMTPFWLPQTLAYFRRHSQNNPA